MTEIKQSQAERLAERAHDARSRAYAPYTKFDAGAAVLHADGTITTGAIVENVSLGLAMCAERVALHTAVTSNDSPPVALALSAPGTRDQPTFPCGACCQVALELGGGELAVVVSNPDGDIHAITTIDKLLPRGPVIED